MFHSPAAQMQTARNQHTFPGFRNLPAIPEHLGADLDLDFTRFSMGIAFRRNQVFAFVVAVNEQKLFTLFPKCDIIV